MNLKNIIQKITIIFFICFFTSSFLNGQNIDSDLLIKEIHLKKNSPNNNWIMVLNPTNKTQTLNNLFVSGIRAINVLPKLNRKENHIILEPNEKVLLCADKNSFNEIWPKNNYPIIEVKSLSLLDGSGFISISTLKNNDGKFDLFRYGDESFTSSNESINKYSNIPFSEGNQVYERQFDNHKKYTRYGIWKEKK